MSCAVIEGDQQTDLDAQRIAETGFPVRQVNTGQACHLDASLIKKAVDRTGSGWTWICFSSRTSAI